MYVKGGRFVSYYSQMDLAYFNTFSKHFHARRNLAITFKFSFAFTHAAYIHYEQHRDRYANKTEFKTDRGRKISV